MNKDDRESIDRDASFEALAQTYEAGLARLSALAADDIETQVLARKDLARNLALGARLLLIYDTLKFVSEQRGPQLRQWSCVVRGQQVKGSELTTVVRFDLQGNAYDLTFREPPVSYEAVHAYLDLHEVSGALLFSTHLELDVNEAGPGWVPRDVEAFVPGAWVKDFLALASRLEAADGDGTAQPGRGEGQDLKRRFGLG